MISIISKFAMFPQSMCEFQASKDGRYGWLLCSSHVEKSHELEEIQTEIKLEILSSKVLEISKMEIESWLKSFFADFHWKLHARMRKSELREKGISLLFAVIYDYEVYFVQFGRLFCAATKGKKLEHVGKIWKNYHVQTLGELNLFGLPEEDIKVKPQHIFLEENESLIVLPGGIAGKVFESGTEINSLPPLIESFTGADNALWLILKNIPQPRKPKKRRLNKLLTSSLFLLLATTFAIVYMAFGNRSCDVFWHKAKKEISTGQMKSMTTEVIANLGKIVNSPARSIELGIRWSADLPYLVSAIPAFTQENIYLAGDVNLRAYNKKNRDLLWEKTFEEPIISLQSTQSGIIVGLRGQKTVGLDSAGTEIWTQSLVTNQTCLSQVHSMEITENEDKRIDSSITVVPLDHGISVLDSKNGTVMSELQLKDKLQYLSAYDDYEHCLYAVISNTLLCIELKIVN